MRQIYKYKVPFGEKRLIVIGPSDKVLTTQLQHGNICVWIEHTKQDFKNCEDWLFFIVGTGIDFQDSGEYVGTVQDGPFVWHVYREKKHV